MSYSYLKKSELVDKCVGMDLGNESELNKLTKKELDDLITSKTDGYEDKSIGETLIEDLDDFELAVDIGLSDGTKLNPMEKYMAFRLIRNRWPFYIQKRIDCPEGWKVNGREYFVVDFYIPGFNIVIETEGKVHVDEDNWIKDRNKSNTLTSMGYSVFRFDWDEVMESNEKFDCLEMINEFVKSKNRELEIIKAFIKEKDKRDRAGAVEPNQPHQR